MNKRVRVEHVGMTGETVERTGTDKGGSVVTT